MSTPIPPEDRAERETDPAAAAGSAQGFEELFAQTAPALFAWAEMRIRPSLRPRLDPEDLLQEVWLRGSRRYPGAGGTPLGFRAWVFRIGKNVMLEAFRALRDENAAGGSPTGRWLALQGIPASVTSFTQHVARDEGVRSFLRAASELEETDRMLIVHCGLEGETTGQAAVKLGLQPEAAKKRWQRLRARLREAPYARTLLE